MTMISSTSVLTSIPSGAPGSAKEYYDRLALEKAAAGSPSYDYGNSGSSYVYNYDNSGSSYDYNYDNSGSSYDYNYADNTNSGSGFLCDFLSYQANKL